MLSACNFAPDPVTQEKPWRELPKLWWGPPAKYDYFNMLGVPTPSWKALCPVQERKQDSKTLLGVGDSGETKDFYFCFTTCNFGFLMVYFINSARSKLYPWSIIHLLLLILASSDLVCILVWCIFVIILFSFPCLKGNKPFTQLHNS